VPKVALGPSEKAIFFSRSPIPYPKNPNLITFYRQVCVYVFTKNSLKIFSKLRQGPLETAEEIELLRFLEYGIPIKMVKVNTRSFGIDTPSDLRKAIRIVREG
jgi:3-deoxy-manno-octulosonate cytidylyltransferase (CMP-KDO synthetase)